MDRIGRIFPWNRELDLGMILILLICNYSNKYIIIYYISFCRALGLGATRGRIYIKHPDVFKVSDYLYLFVCFFYNIYHNPR